MAARASDRLPPAGDRWAGAACMLLVLDATDRVTAVNDRYLARTGYRHHDVVGRLFWGELLSGGSRVFYQTQLAPVLQLDRQLEEVMVDLRTADGSHLPALMNATRQIGSGG